jgi:hypothetical protein
MQRTGDSAEELSNIEKSLRIYLDRIEAIVEAREKYSESIKNTCEGVTAPLDVTGLKLSDLPDIKDVEPDSESALTRQMDQLYTKYDRFRKDVKGTAEDIEVLSEIRKLSEAMKEKWKPTADDSWSWEQEIETKSEEFKTQYLKYIRQIDGRRKNHRDRNPLPALKGLLSQINWRSRGTPIMVRSLPELLREPS